VVVAVLSKALQHSASFHHQRNQHRNTFHQTRTVTVATQTFSVRNRTAPSTPGRVLSLATHETRQITTETKWRETTDNDRIQDRKAV
jgi:hypothetical protein